MRRVLLVAAEVLLVGLALAGMGAVFGLMAAGANADPEERPPPGWVGP